MACDVRLCHVQGDRLVRASIVLLLRAPWERGRGSSAGGGSAASLPQPLFSFCLLQNDVDLAVFNPDWPALLKGLKQHLPPNKYSLKGGLAGRWPATWRAAWAGQQTGRLRPGRVEHQWQYRLEVGMHAKPAAPCPLASPVPAPQW